MPQVEIVQASAGSGKTFTLSKKYLELVLKHGPDEGPVSLKNTLAITFTNNAAIEMKSRIIEFLKKISLDDFKDEKERSGLLSGLPGKGAALKTKATRVMENIIREYDLFSIRTIDSFINTLIQASAFKLGVSSRFRVEDLFKAYIEYSFDDMVESASGDKELLKMFRAFLEQYIYIEAKEGWIARKDILELLSALFSIKNVYGLALQKSGISASKIIEKKKSVIKKLNELKAELPDGTNKKFLESLDKFLANNTEVFDMGGLSAYFTYPEIPVNKGSEASSKAKRAWDMVKGSLSEISEWEMLSRFDCYIDLYERTELSLKEIAAKEDVIFLEELNRKATALFGDDGVTVDEMYARLATRFLNYLIDEFQDTSSLQWSNLKMMVEDALSRGGSLFLVGDKKQAIYRFRGGNIKLLDDIRDNYSALGVETRPLACNFRSVPQLVEFSNSVFAPANIKRFIVDNPGTLKKGGDDILLSDDVKDIAEVFSLSVQEPVRGEPRGYVSVDVLGDSQDDDPMTQVKDKVITLLKELITRMHSSDIAILTRSNDDAELVTGWLIDEGIQVQSEKTLDIREHYLVKEMTAFLAFLKSPVDNISFSAFLAGEIFLKASGLTRSEVNSFLFNAARKKTGDAKGTHLYKEFRKTYPKVWEELINIFFKRAGIVPVYELAVSIFTKYRTMEAFPREQAFIMKFLEFVKTFEDRYSGIQDFLSFLSVAPLSAVYVDAGAPKAVRVMTIHQSKGLEFGAVVLPFFSMSIKVGMGKSGPGGAGKVSQSRPFVVRPTSDGVRLLYLNKDHATYSALARHEYRIEYKNALVDELNVAYVALTRAKNELYVFVEEKKGTRANAARSLFPELPYVSGVKGMYKNEKKKEAHVLKVPPKTENDWIELIKEEFVKDTVLTNRKNITRGNICHFMLSLVGARPYFAKASQGKHAVPLHNADDIIRYAVSAAKIKFPLSDELDSCGETVKKILNNENLKKYFFSKEAEVYVEKDIVSKKGDMRRVDRLVVLGGEVTVIDYKNTRITGDPLGYVEQVREYKEILKDIYPGKKIAGLLVYLEENTTEFV